MVEGARDSTQLFHRKRSVEASAPSTILLRKMVPLPPLSRGRKVSERLGGCNIGELELHAFLAVPAVERKRAGGVNLPAAILQ
jgi:hypothetical protein